MNPWENIGKTRSKLHSTQKTDLVNNKVRRIDAVLLLENQF